VEIERNKTIPIKYTNPNCKATLQRRIAKPHFSKDIRRFGRKSHFAFAETFNMHYS